MPKARFPVFGFLYLLPFCGINLRIRNFQESFMEKHAAADYPTLLTWCIKLSKSASAPHILNHREPIKPPWNFCIYTFAEWDRLAFHSQMALKNLKTLENASV